MRSMVAKYAGRCTACAQPIGKGDKIAHAGRGATYHEACAASRFGLDGTQLPQEPAPVGQAYQSTARRFRTLPRGKCIDAPCCGCCD
jgi:hypothetical protein